jgi:hypothetical protein
MVLFDFIARASMADEPEIERERERESLAGIRCGWRG